MIHLYYGNGKGKTSAAVGAAVRALGNQDKVVLIKFFKQDNSSSEDRILKKIKNCVVLNSRFSHPAFYKKIDPDKQEKIRAEQRALFRKIDQFLRKKYRFIILDEALDLIPARVLASSHFLELFNKIRPEQELILTGHSLPGILKKRADLVTKMKKIKHYFDRNISARKGVEF